jgi:limonene-1,2-epoxide hydrolase
MDADAYNVLKEFWQNQDSGDYTTTEHLFAEDALFVDPIYGTFQGREQIGAFLRKMNQAVTSINGVFRLEKLSGNETTAWAQWSFTSDHGYREGVGVYEVSNGEITYYRDYMNESSGD